MNPVNLATNERMFDLLESRVKLSSDIVGMTNSVVYGAPQ